MSNYQVEPANKPQALTTEAIKAVRHEQVKGVSRRELLRGSLAAGLGLWLLEITAGTIGFLWPNLEGKFGGDVVIGTLDDVKAFVPALPVDEGFPAYYSVREGVRDPDQSRPAGSSSRARTPPATAPPSTSAPSTSAARTWAASPTRARRTSGSSARATGPATTGSASRRRATSTAPRRAAWTASRSRSTAQASLTINTGKITLGPLPVAVGQPGIIPPRTPTGCI